MFMFHLITTVQIEIQIYFNIFLVKPFDSFIAYHIPSWNLSFVQAKLVFLIEEHIKKETFNIMTTTNHKFHN